ncbi:uncharacterized protein LOC116181929 [Photinus pyralis]|uniref:uncharacterized protein LOC116165103 n=1 Tax=Photinus pyralis TaxID=7054 RepID=UPI001266F5AF|nr:uncharacterized protein LOC116165103 [Photinus pyralis]XP_031358243.1 uncharacterized protein LOC116181929 [Photinus pyralis]
MDLIMQARPFNRILQGEVDRVAHIYTANDTTGKYCAAILWGGECKSDFCKRCAPQPNSYDAAYRAESVLLEKSDLESTDIEAIKNPTQVLDKKRRKNKRVIPNCTSARDESELSSSENESAVIDLNLPPAPDTTLITINETVSTEDPANYIPVYVNNNEPETDLGNNGIYKETPSETRIETNSIDITDINDVPLSLATERQVNDIKELIIVQNTKIENLIALVNDMSKSKQFKQLKRGNEKNTDANVTTATRWNFPMQTIDDIKKLDESLKSGDDDSVKEFKCFILQLGGTTLKTTIKFIIKELYSIELQQNLNYSGRENKFSTKDLVQTKLILEAVQHNTRRTQVEAINEYMYHMQHVTDRVRAMMKKNNK